MNKMVKTLALVACMGVLLTSCNKWLDVQPEDQISDDKLFSDAMGFRNSLNGIYQQAAGGDLYGRAFTWGFNSVIAQEYATTQMYVQPVVQTAQYNYTHSTVQDEITRIWASTYNTIANCNKLIGEVEEADEALFPLKETEKNLILGEALAMRGLLHFELLRLFAPAPEQNMSGSYMPYQSEYPVKYIPPVPTSKILEQVVADLDRAKDLVAGHDTLLNRGQLSGKLGAMLLGHGDAQGGIFFSFRMTRLNYVAINGLLARVYRYAGDAQRAAEAAEYVHSQYGPHGTLKWWGFTTQANSQGVNKFHKLVDDVLFGVYDRELIANINAYKSYSAFFLTEAVAAWFPPNERDYRSGLVESDRTSAKWRESTSSTQYVPDQNTLAPVMRMSEVYYILSESLFEQGRVDEALEVLNQIRNARGKMDTFGNRDPEAFYNELLAEYRRDFLLEGQTVFAHKRLNTPMLIGTRVIPMDARFVIPVPEGELIF